MVDIYTTAFSRCGRINSAVISSIRAIIRFSVSIVILPSQEIQSSSNLLLKEKNISGKTALGIYPKARWRRYSDTKFFAYFFGRLGILFRLGKKESMNYDCSLAH